jgi:hypothetical protein
MRISTECHNVDLTDPCTRTNRELDTAPIPFEVTFFCLMHLPKLIMNSGMWAVRHRWEPKPPTGN